MTYVIQELSLPSPPALPSHHKSLVLSLSLIPLFPVDLLLMSVNPSLNLDLSMINVPGKSVPTPKRISLFYSRLMDDFYFRRGASVPSV